MRMANACAAMWHGPWYATTQMGRPRRALPLLVLLAVLLSACHEKGGIRIASLDFDGVEQVDKSALADALQTKKGSWLPWGRKTYFDRSAFQADLDRIVAFYRDRGFPDARVRSVDVNLNDAQDAVHIAVHVIEGQPIRVAGVDLTGFDVLSASQRRSLETSLPLQPGQPLDRQLALATRDRAVDVLRDHGYPYARVAVRSDRVSPKTQQIVLEATPGPVAHFGVIDIRGETTVDEDVIRRQLAFGPGDLFRRSAMAESQRKLYQLDLFQFANVESLEDPDIETTDVPVRVTVAESKHRKVTTGFGYGSEEHARATIRWDNLNVFGDAQHVGIEGKWSSLDRGVRLDYTEPYVFSPNLSLRVEGQAWQAAEPVYSTNQLGGRIVLQHQKSSRNTWSLSVLNQYQRTVIQAAALEDFTIRDQLISLGLDPTRGVTQGTLSALAFDITRTTADSVLDPRRGYTLTGHVEQAGRFMRGSYSYVGVNGEARHYLPMGTAVLATRVGFGAIQPAADLPANVPFHKRFFLGGATSVRGWGRYEISPLSGAGFPIGGLSMAQATTELRVPLGGKFGAVGFIDAGQVGYDTWDFDLSQMRYAIGPGLRYETPIGPIRVDVGYQLNPIDHLLVEGEPQKRRFRVHFSIGQAF